MLGYSLNKNWKVQAELSNLLNRKDSAIDYYYPSRRNDQGIADIHFHPVEPVNFRMSLTASF
ncbi:MAG: TonB-dependent receptor [Methylococcales bacterium]|nr:TonB-dependent receptor [Methylococcales bacterium]